MPIRHYFNTRHADKGNPLWTWAATAVLFLVIVWLSALTPPKADREEAALPPAIQRFVDADGFEDAYDIVVGNCSMCHGAEPGYDGIPWAPKGVHLETEAQVAFEAKRIYLQAGVTHAMPPPAASYLDNEDRAVLVAWYRAATGG